MATRIRHYINEEGVYLHADDLQESLLRIAHTLDEGSKERSTLMSVADGLRAHKLAVVESSLSNIFALAGRFSC